MITDKQQSAIVGIAYIVGIVLSAFYNPIMGLSVLLIASFATPMVNQITLVQPLKD